ncbi:hypothetical protein J7E80_21700 [Arthrobacter sp. ISL-28]|nr:hypothetical protein [Arthrobacter sp. ISL-28]
MTQTTDAPHPGAGTTFYGYVQADSRSFRTTSNGRAVFEPINSFYGTVHPTAQPGSGDLAVEFDLVDGEYFQVREEIDKSEGRMGTRPAGNFLASSLGMPTRSVPGSRRRIRAFLATARTGRLSPTISTR